MAKPNLSISQYERSQIYYEMKESVFLKLLPEGPDKLVASYVRMLPESVQAALKDPEIKDYISYRHLPVEGLWDKLVKDLDNSIHIWRRSTSGLAIPFPRVSFKSASSDINAENFVWKVVSGASEELRQQFVENLNEYATARETSHTSCAPAYAFMNSKPRLSLSALLKECPSIEKLAPKCIAALKSRLANAGNTTVLTPPSCADVELSLSPFTPN
jgi:hypothetical protein